MAATDIILPAEHQMVIRLPAHPNTFSICQRNFRPGIQSCASYKHAVFRPLLRLRLLLFFHHNVVLCLHLLLLDFFYLRNHRLSGLYFSGRRYQSRYGKDCRQTGKKQYQRAGRSPTVCLPYVCFRPETADIRRHADIEKQNEK